MKQRKGFTLIELLVVIAIIALLIGLLLPALAKAQQNARSLKDKTQIKQIHQAMLVWANDNKERLPTPGLINRLEDPWLAQQVPGVGPHDYELNHSAALYSYMVAAEYFPTKLLIGPTEVNPFIREYVNYNFDAYDPASDQFWDPDFSIDMTTDTTQGGNASYMHMALVGKRWSNKWRSTTAESFESAIIGTRGTENGEFDTDNYRFSQTLELHGPRNQWVGNLALTDNSTTSIVSFYPTLVVYQPTDVNNPVKDNIYAAEFADYPLLGDEEASNDEWMILNDEGSVEQYIAGDLIYDPLN